jgi:hypothetical protein
VFKATILGFILIFIRKIIILWFLSNSSFPFMKRGCLLFRCWSVTTLFICGWKPGTYMSRKNISRTLWDYVLVLPCLCGFVAISMREFSVPYISEDKCHSSFMRIDISDYLYLLQSVSDWLFLFLVFIF